jgi:uncharacterized phage-associated protein
MYDALLIAHYFINKSTPYTIESVTNLKLQKLLYYAQGFYIANNPNRQLLFTDKIEAWVHGPVVPKVYREYSHFKYHDIDQDIDQSYIANISERDTFILDMVWNTFKVFSGKELERITHKEDPWKNARRNLEWYEYGNETIDPLLIAEYFEQEYLETRVST